MFTAPFFSPQFQREKRRRSARFILETLEERATPATLFGNTEFNNLVSFDSATPGVFLTSAPITGLVSEDSILGIDFRPTTGELFGLGRTNIYTIDPATAMASVRAPLTAAPGDDNPFVALIGTSFGVGFDPTLDLAGDPSFRVVSQLTQNLRINVVSGEVTTDTNITLGIDTPLTAVAYSNNDLDPATGTTLYAYEFSQDDLMTSTDPNGGAYTDVNDAPSGVSASDLDFIGLAIETRSSSINFGYLTLTELSAPLSANLYSMSLITGATNLIGPIGDAPTRLRSLAVAPAGSIQFSDPTYSVGESGPVATITVDRVGGSAGQVSALFTTSDDTANAPADYIARLKVIVFDPGVTTSQTVTISINNDESSESDELVNLILSNPTGGAILGPQSTAKLTIVDDDGTISGRVYLDHNGDGSRGETEEGLPDRVVYIDANNDGVLQVSEARAVTDERGDYSLDQPLGPFVVRVALFPIDVSTDGGKSAVLAERTIKSIDLGIRLNGVNLFAPIVPDLYTDQSATDNEQILEAIYHSILNRPSDPAGKASWLDQLNRGATVRDVVKGFERSDEYAGLLIDQLYRTILDRDADPTGMATWTGVVRNMNEPNPSERIIVGLFTSAEFAAKTPTSASFVSELYRRILGRTADAGAATWVAALDTGGSRESVILGFLNSEEARLRLINACYDTYYNRDGEPTGLPSWITYFESFSSSPTDFVAEFLNGDEFSNRSAAGAG